MKTIQSFNKLSLETRIMVEGGLVSLALMLFAFLTKDPLAFALGVLFGGAYSILNFRLMQLTFDKAMKMRATRAQKYVQTRYFLRHLITGVVIYVAIINPWVNTVFPTPKSPSRQIISPAFASSPIFLPNSKVSFGDIVS